MIRVTKTGFTKKGNAYADVIFDKVPYRYILVELTPAIIQFHMDDIKHMKRSDQGKSNKVLSDKIKADASHYCKSGGEWVKVGEDK